MPQLLLLLLLMHYKSLCQLLLSLTTGYLHHLAVLTQVTAQHKPDLTAMPY